ncbi:MAG TPA: potassium transporter Kup, partial [Rhodospirillaceae bacterium]|nr:potassium transporter Kup [Rhodospirillaceae bacterium]
ATLGIFAAALFYGDSVITPAISVLSAIEGLDVAAPGLKDFVIPITIAILIALFAIQRKGTSAVGELFGPVMILYFSTIGVLGFANIIKHPSILKALNPYYAAAFLVEHGIGGFLALASVVLAVTGGEALYADMGHFGRRPISFAWHGVVLPALVLCYFGQGALVLRDNSAIENPFFLMAPHWALVPMVVLAAVATVIASQAVISGAFSVTAQAIQLGYLPRMRLTHTSEREIGQIYIGSLNWALLVAVIVLVLGFRSSSNLAAAYGIAVTGTMACTTMMVSMVAAFIWKWKNRAAYAMLGFFLLVDLAFFSANATKITSGGWFPLAVATVIFVLLTTWKSGRDLAGVSRAEEAMPEADFLMSVGNSSNVFRPKGTAIFLTSLRDGIPPALLHNLKHNQVLHKHTVLLTIMIAEVPHIPHKQRLERIDIAEGLHRLILHFGYMDRTNIPKTLANASEAELGFYYEPMRVSYFLSRETIIPNSHSDGLNMFRDSLFAWMNRSAASAMDFFNLPPNRVVELGSQVII